MSSGGSFFESKKFKNIMKYIYGWGASIVIVGALFKILHWPGADIMLIVGLLTEAFIFFVSVFEPMHEDPDWSLVYPELALGHADDHKGLDDGEDLSVTQELDNMLEEAKIDSDLITSLGEGMRNLSDNANQLGKVSGAAGATEEYVSSLKGASERVTGLSDVYEKASQSLLGIAESSDDGGSFGEQLQKVSQNLAALNNVYELQLKGSSESLEQQQKLQDGISSLMSNLHDSVEDTRLYKENMAQLAQNLTALNTVYGNMLNAMTVRE